MLEYVDGLCLYAKFSSESMHFLALQHSVLALPSGAELTLNANAQLKTFLYPTVPKPFLYSSIFMMAKSLA